MSTSAATPPQTDRPAQTDQPQDAGAGGPRGPDMSRVFETIADGHDYAVEDLDGSIPAELRGTLYRPPTPPSPLRLPRHVHSARRSHVRSKR